MHKVNIISLFMFVALFSIIVSLGVGTSTSFTISLSSGTLVSVVCSSSAVDLEIDEK